MGIALTADSIVYTINASAVATLSNIGSTNQFSEAIFQAHNFGGDPSIAGAIFQPYTAYWSDSVPEPGTIALVLCGVPLYFLKRRCCRR